jgi:UDP-2,3-diacylglucosamine hydrolase
MERKRGIVIVADAHVHGGPLGKSDEFFQMLDHLRKIRLDVVFLGDVFELWIGLKGYEDALHRRFVDWCAEAKTNFSVGFIEGNHEYHVRSKRSGAFTWVSDDGFLLDSGVYLAHGDLINIKDWRYRLMRGLFKSGLARRALDVLRPVGPGVADRLRRALKGTNMEHRKGVPSAVLEHFAGRCERLGVKSSIVGHFHEKGHHVAKNGVEIWIVPSWRDAGVVAVYTPGSAPLEFKRWSEVW